MEGRCERHLFDRAVDLCGRCGCEFCADCIVYSFGPKKPPFCLPCAVEAAGVRKGAGFRGSVGRKDLKAMERRREEFLAQRDLPGATKSAPSAMDDSWLQRLEEPATRSYPGVVADNGAGGH